MSAECWTVTTFSPLFFFNNSIDVWPAERPPGYDRVRNAEIGNKDFELDVLEEAYTTEHWLVRIYKVPWLFPFYFCCWYSAAHPLA